MAPGPPPDGAAPSRDLLGFLAGGGEMGRRIRAFDWAATPLGPAEGWSPSLKIAVRIMLASRQPIWVGWGRQLTYLYNDAYLSIIGGKHPWALGRPTMEVWAEIRDAIEPMLATALRGQEGTYVEEQLLIMERNGYEEETYYTFSYSPIPDENGEAGGIICANTDDTRRVIGERQLGVLRELSTAMTDARSWREACQRGIGSMAADPFDVPFAMMYAVNGPAGSTEVSLVEATGVESGHALAPARIVADEPSLWPISEVLQTHAMCVVSHLSTAADGEVPAGAWPRAPSQAVAVPIPVGESGRNGVLIIGLNPYRLFDDDYQGFVKLVASQLAAGIANAHAYESAKQRAEALAEIDRAKTEFFSNVSHEFRTPLTLMLGPARELMEMDAASLPREARHQVGMIHRNALRLQKLVNTLLDFSRVESGRLEASFEPTDLAALTIDIGSAFRSAIETAGLRMVVDVSQLPEQVYVDRDLWEKIVLNLVSNALKFTAAGEITIALHDAGDTVQFRVRDTGAGLPPEESKRIFDRFYRVAGQQSRTHEGTGIGLALVQELVRMHGGEISVESAVGVGSTFLVTLPKGSAHLPSERLRSATPSGPSAAAEYAGEALRWLSDDTQPSATELQQGDRPRVLLADDNHDMREYVGRLLAERYDVVSAADGQEALLAIREHRPDLVVSDVMMPRMDGLDLVQVLRNDPATRSLPVLLLSARSGEQQRIAGLQAGADAYLEKPFSAQELRAVVGAQLQIAHARNLAHSALRDSERRLVQVFETAPAFMALLRGPELVIEKANPAWLHLAGKQPDVIGKPLLEAMPEVADQPFPRLLRKVMATGEALRGSGVQVLVADAGGQLRERWVDFVYEPLREPDGEISGVLAHGVDLTERMAAEARVRDSEQKLRAVLDTMPQKVFAATAAGEVDYLNPRWKQFTGLPHEQMRDWSAFVHPDDFAENQRLWTRSIETGEPFLMEHRFQQADGDYRWHLSRALAITNEQGEITTWIGASTDIHDLREATNQLHALTAELSAADTRKNEFLALLAHELRNPLAPVSNALQVMRMADGNPKTQAFAIGVIERQVAHLVRLVDDLLDVGRISRGKIELRREPLDLNAAVAQASESALPVAREMRHALSTTVPDEVLRVDADPTRLAQIIGNLLTNACKFTEGGGRIDLSLEREGGEGVIRVRDTGVGIAPAQRERIFEMFTQLDNSIERAVGGLGIGLSLVRTLVEMHGGTVTVQSEGAGCGSEFTVRLPLLARGD